jgi:hypothetical protein
VRFYLGLDLGQAQDPTAIAVIEREAVPVTGIGTPDQPRYTFMGRHLERVKLGTSYPAIVAHALKTAR